jgi:type I restriction enzyme, S subunit
MNTWPVVQLGDIFDIARGGSPRPIDRFITDDPDGVSWILIGDASDESKYISRTKKRIKPDGVSRSRRVKPGDFLLTNSMSFGRPYIMAMAGCIHDGWLVLSPKRADIDRNYFYYLLGSSAIYAEFERLAAGATVKNLNIDLVKSVSVHLPPISYQEKAAAILDQADALRRARRHAIVGVNNLAEALFYEMFGDPARNDRRLPEQSLSNIAVKFSDGPFGSNLKSEHYVENGVRVIRLQNIGVREFKDEDRAYISKAHFRSLAKFRCEPGDVLVGTLGDPNLRACILPEGVEYAINKADCVQIRVDESRATREYICSLLNIPSVEKKAQDKILGQTRSRISMGRLKELVVPIPPLDNQRNFSEAIRKLDAVKQASLRSLAQLAELFNSLQHSAFRGRLTRSDGEKIAALRRVS